jgi:hypothetical protein
MHREWVWLMPCTTCSARAGANGKVQLEATYTVPTGRCCNGSTCTEVTEAACTGYYAGDDSHCSSTPWGPTNYITNQCDDLGGCCNGTTCTMTNPGDCTGTYFSTIPGKWWSACGGDPCSDPTGSCCRGSVCSVETESNCSDGVWSSGGSCSAGDCPQGTGSYFIG